MTTAKGHLRNIDRSTAAGAQSAAQNTELLRGIAFTNSATMVFSGITALNSIRQARAHEQQIDLQRQIAEQTARHEFSMWRQTPEGVAFVEWQSRAASLLPFLRARDQAWVDAWHRAIVRLQVDYASERQRIVAQPAQERQRGLLIAAIVALVFGVFWLPVLFTILLLAAYFDGTGTVGGSVVIAGVLAAAGLGGGIAALVQRRRMRKAALANRVVIHQEAEARRDRFGFDPIYLTDVPWIWAESEGFVGYADQVEHLIITGAASRPMPSQLIGLQIPTPLGDDEDDPVEVRQLLAEFRAENERLVEKITAG